METTQTRAIDTISIKETVRQIVAKVGDVEIEAITDDAAFVEDLGLDSLTATEIVFEVEKAYDITFSEEEARDIKRLGDVPEKILARLQDK